MCTQHFATILNFLRDAECELPASARERKELLREAEFYEVSNPMAVTPAYYHEQCSAPIAWGAYIQ